MKPKKILSIGDVHIFNRKRHKEHLDVLKKLIETIKNQNIDLVYIGGDVVDSKARLSPEQVSVVGKYFKEISDIVPIVMIPGNHDLDLRKEGSMDSLTAILEHIQTKHPIHYLKKTGIYNLYDVDWAVWSCIDNKNPFDTSKKSGYTIGCFHGPIKEASVESGWSKFQTNITVDTFKDCDVAFLADIHKIQTFRNNEISYCGSLLQVNIDESSERGGVLWEWSDTQSKYIPSFCKIDNYYGFKTYEVKNLDTFDPLAVDLPSKGFMCRLLYTGKQLDYVSVKFQELKKKVKTKYPDNEVILQKRFEKIKVVAVKKDDTVVDAKTADFLKKFCDTKRLDEELYKSLKALDEAYNKKIDTSDYQVGEYFIEELEIENFLSYGGNNKIEFRDLQGLIGLFADNRTGKTNTLHSLMFCLFNKTPKNSTSLQSLINDQMPEGTSAFVQVKLNINGNIWTIKRSIVPGSKNVSIKLEVYENVDGEEIPRHQESRPTTDNQVLKKLLGTEDMFLTLVLCTSKNSNEFTDNKNAARLDLIMKFLGITIYDQKLQVVDEDLKALNISTKQLFKEFENLTPIETLNKEKQDLITQNQITENNIEELKKENEEREVVIEKVSDNIKALNILGVERSMDSLISEKSALTNEKKVREETLTKNKTSFEETVALKESYNTWLASQITIDKDALVNSRVKIGEINNEIKALEKILNQAEICPTCNQPWCADKEQASAQKAILAVNLSSEKENLLLIQEIDAKSVKLEALDNALENLKLSEDKILAQIETTVKKIEVVDQQIAILNDNAVKIEQRNKLYDDLARLQTELKAKMKEVTTFEISISSKNTRLQQIDKEVAAYSAKKEEVEGQEQAINLLGLYKSAVHRTGIPALILQTCIPTINETLNNYIEDLFDFNVNFEYADDSLDVYFSYPHLKNIKRDVVQASGMEGTIINLAIRAALNEINMLPKPSLLMLDEIFNTLDATELEKFKEFLVRLKDCYQNIVIISHLDDIKDLPDHFIKLEKVDGITSVLS